MATFVTKSPFSYKPTLDMCTLFSLATLSKKGKEHGESCGEKKPKKRKAWVERKKCERNDKEG